MNLLLGKSEVTKYLVYKLEPRALVVKVSWVTQWVTIARPLNPSQGRAGVVGITDRAVGVGILGESRHRERGAAGVLGIFMVHGQEYKTYVNGSEACCLCRV